MKNRFRTFAAAAILLAPALAHAQLFTLSKEQLIELTSQNPFERFADGRPKVPDSIIERARGMSAEEIERVIRATGAADFDSCHKKGSHTDSRT